MNLRAKFKGFNFLRAKYVYIDNTLNEEIVCEINFFVSYYCHSVPQKHCILWKDFLRIMPIFCIFF